MRIPKRLKELIDRSHELSGAVNQAIADIEPWVKDNKLVFFDEYTDHGIDHIENVMATADAIISDEARPVLTPGDAAVLVLSILLHDAAMHLYEDGFVALMEPKGERPLMDGFGDKSWPALWEDFCWELKRWDGRKLTKVFGGAEPISIPRLEPGNMSDRDKKAIGEFLRRHHARLAHEIALLECRDRRCRRV